MVSYRVRYIQNTYTKRKPIRTTILNKPQEEEQHYLGSGKRAVNNNFK